MSVQSPGPWVDYEKTEIQPWLTHTGIVKFIEFPVRIKEMSPRAFHLYWQKHHSPNVMNVTGFAQYMRKYTNGHAYPEKTSGLPAHYKQTASFEGASEVWINSLGEVGDWLAHPHYAELIQPDEPRFISQEGDCEFIVAKEERLYEPVADMVESLKTKVYLLVKRKQGQDFKAFHAGASVHGKLILEQESLRRHLNKLVVSHKLQEPLPLEGFEMDNIDAVYELWFKDITAMQAFFSEEDYVSKIIDHEEGIFDVNNIRAVVAKIRVVHDEFSFQPSTTQPMPFSW